jgi:hypothetical protein
MPENTPQTIADSPIASLGTDMSAKSLAEKDRAINQDPDTLLEDGQEEQSIWPLARDFKDKVEDVSEKMINNAEALKKDYHDDGLDGVVDFEEEVKGSSEYIKGLNDQLKEALPDLLIKISKKYTETEQLGEEVQKIVELLNKLSNIEEEYEQAEEILQSLPDEIKESLENITYRAGTAYSFGTEKINRAKKMKENDPLRYNKLKEIAQNAQKNYETMNRTVGRDMTSDFAKKNIKLAGPSEAEKQMNKGYIDRVSNRITENMQKKGASQEEISEMIERMKERIERARQDEKSSINPSSYTTPLS